MRFNIRSRALTIGLGMAVVMLWSCSAFAWNNQEHYQNKTGQTAYGLTKILAGTHSITDAIHTTFSNHTVIHSLGKTIISWSGGTVPNNGSASVCFETKSGHKAPVVCVYWTDESGNMIGSIPVMGSYPQASLRTVSGPGGPTVVATVTNAASQCGGTPQPIELSDIGYAFEDREPYTMEELNCDLGGWTPTDPAVCTLKVGLSKDFDLGTYTRGNLVRFMYRATVGTAQLDCEIVQSTVPLVPALTEWGLLVLAVLVLASGVWVVIQRKRTARVRA